jgi:hypothetical protein
MICPNCEYDYVKGITNCPDCNIELISEEEFQGNLTHHSDWLVIYTSSDRIEMEMLKSNLAGADIEALILSQKDSSYPAVGDLAIIKLLVKKSDATDAATIINDINNKTELE